MTVDERVRSRRAPPERRFQEALLVAMARGDRLLVRPPTLANRGRLLLLGARVWVLGWRYRAHRWHRLRSLRMPAIPDPHRRPGGRGGTAGSPRPVPRRERGSAPLELVLLAIPALAVMMLIVFVGRVARADGTLDGVAHYAALRSAQARSADAADAAARDAAAADLDGAGLPCEATDVEVDTGDFRSGGTVGVTVTCRLRLSDLGPLPVPGTRLVTSRSVAVVDVFRATS